MKLRNYCLLGLWMTGLALLSFWLGTKIDTSMIYSNRAIVIARKYIVANNGILDDVEPITVKKVYEFRRFFDDQNDIEAVVYIDQHTGEVVSYDTKNDEYIKGR